MRRRPKARHLAQRRVVEDHVGRHAARARDLEPHGAQALEERAIDVLPRLGLDARLRVAARPCAADAAARAPARDSVVSSFSSARPFGVSASTGYSSSVCCSRPSAGELLDVAAHLGDRRVAAAGRTCSACRALARRPARDRVPAQHARDVRRAEPLPDPRDARQNLAREHDRLGHRSRARRGRSRTPPQPSCLRRVAIAEVLGEMPVPAADARRRSAPSAAAAPSLASVSSPLLLEHQAPLHEVGGRVDQHALGLEAVAPRASGLLLVVLERSRRAGVHDEPHVRSVDAHAEGDGGDDDVDAFAEERVLVAAALRVRRAPRDTAAPATPIAGQPRGQRIDFAARRAVDDARPRGDGASSTSSSCRFSAARGSTR